MPFGLWSRVPGSDSWSKMQNVSAVLGIATTLIAALFYIAQLIFPSQKVATRDDVAALAARLDNLLPILAQQSAEAAILQTKATQLSPAASDFRNELDRMKSAIAEFEAGPQPQPNHKTNASQIASSTRIKEIDSRITKVSRDIDQMHRSVLLGNKTMAISAALADKYAALAKSVSELKLQCTTLRQTLLELVVQETPPAHLTDLAMRVDQCFADSKLHAESMSKASDDIRNTTSKVEMIAKDIEALSDLASDQSKRLKALELEKQLIKKFEAADGAVRNFKPKEE